MTENSSRRNFGPKELRTFLGLHQLMNLQSSLLRNGNLLYSVLEKRAMNAGNGGPTRQDGYFLSPFTTEWPLSARANQERSTMEPRHGHAACTLRMHPPTSHCPALSADAEPNSQGSHIMKLKVSHCRYAMLGIKRLQGPLCGKQTQNIWSVFSVHPPLIKLLSSDSGHPYCSI